MKTLQEYLIENIGRGFIDHRIRAQLDVSGKVEFYIHPIGANGDTLDFRVEGNTLIPKR